MAVSGTACGELCKLPSMVSSSAAILPTVIFLSPTGPHLAKFEDLSVDWGPPLPNEPTPGLGHCRGRLRVMIRKRLKCLFKITYSASTSLRQSMVYVIYLTNI